MLIHSDLVAATHSLIDESIGLFSRSVLLIEETFVACLVPPLDETDRECTREEWSF